MIQCLELNKSFATKQEMFKALADNSKEIIGLKKAAIQKSADKGQLSNFNLFKITDETKSLLGLKENHIYPVINTTKYLDSHGDVHMDGIWSKSIQEQKGQIYYVADHELKTTSVIAFPADVNAFVKEVPWSFVGKGFEGNTQALIYEIPKEAIKLQAAKDIIEQKQPVQNSVRMQYVKIRLAMDSTEKEHAEFKNNFDGYVDVIANKEQAKEQGYFWIVDEAKISKEGSMVLFGSNDATPIQYTEAGSSTSDKQEPSDDTQNEKVKEMLTELIKKI